MSVNILMCTYNGEKYLRAQLDSIIKQSYPDWRLYIRDDGSTDNTVSIIREYVEKNPDRIVLVNAPKHLGYPDCFWDILRRCPKADYYAFSDQDDVWAPDKLESATRMLDREENGLPILYMHDYDNCDGNLKLISHHSLGDINTLTDRSILFYTYASGFCMVINNAMRDMLNALNLIGKAMYHDELCIWMAHFYGKTLYDDSVLTKYRRHEATVTEYGNGVGTLISNWLRREILGPEFGYKCKRIRNFLMLETLISNTSDKDKGPNHELFQRANEFSGIKQRVRSEWSLLSGGKSSVFRYFRRLCYPHRLKPTIGGELALRIMLLMNRR